VQFLAASRLVIVAGKGGVGKTTVAAALAWAAAAEGLRTALVEVDPAGPLGPRLGLPTLGYDAVEVPGAGSTTGSLVARAITPDDALGDYLDAHGLGRLAGRLARSGTLDVVATAAPGIDDLLVLGKVKQLERSGAADVILVDAPASGHAISFLRSPRGLLDAVSRGPVHTQAREVLDLLTDGRRCQVLLVALPEETPVNELVETAFSLEEDVGIKLGPVLLNGSYPAAALPGPAEAARLVTGRRDAAALLDALRFRARRGALQAMQAERLSAALPLHQLRTSFRFVPAFGRSDVDALADELADAIDRLP
jgi:anion-transporting  ArsA/GET3 family ATPase